jgi:hypothetical protein
MPCAAVFGTDGRMAASNRACVKRKDPVDEGGAPLNHEVRMRSGREDNDDDPETKIVDI